MLAVTDDEGRTVLQIGLAATLYFEGAHTTEVREEVVACFEQYEALCGERLRWEKHPETFEWHPREEGAVPTPRAWLRDLNPDMPWEFDFHGGDTTDAASHFRVQALGAAAWQPRLSYFRIALAVTWFADHPGDFPSLVQDMCRRLRPVSGYGGLTVLESPDGLIQQEHEPSVFDLAQRFPGLEVDYPPLHILYLKDGIKGVNWLTVLGEPWLARLSGDAKLRELLGDEFGFYDFPGGLMIRAGLRPQMGDTQRGRYPELYARAASALSSVQIQKHRSFHHAGPERFDRATSEAWLKRLNRT
jgi:hypothetical protein